MTRSDTATKLLLAAMVAMIAIGFIVPGWLNFLIIAALTKALVVMGVVVLMRSGLVSFGQGLYFCAGGYAVGLGGNFLGLTDIIVLLVFAGVTGLVLGAIIGLLMSRYREIFFAMFSLALSMILFGILSKSQTLGSTDGFNVVTPTLFGQSMETAQVHTMVYITTVLVVFGGAILIHRFIKSPLGYAGRAVEENEIRLEYLGLSPRKVVYVNYVLAAVVAALGGGLTAFSLGHVGPEMAFWAQSGEFIFIALLGGIGNVAAPIIGAGVFELVRSYALEHAPDVWQLILGTVLILFIVFLPKGLWSLVDRVKKKEAA